jgi:hypothetical protein
MTHQALFVILICQNVTQGQEDCFKMDELEGLSVQMSLVLFDAFCCVYLMHMNTFKSQFQLFYKYNIKLSLLTGMNYNCMFQLKVSIIRSVPKICGMSVIEVT